MSLPVNNPPDRLPKVELHSHLDCILSLEAVQRLRPGIDAAEYRAVYTAPAKCRDLAHYLQCTIAGVQLLQTAEALEIAVEDLFRQLQDDGVIYSEIRFAPLLHIAQGLSAERVVQIVDTACERRSTETGIEARLILCTLRHFSAAQSRLTAELVDAFRGRRVAALDLAGSEAGFPLDAHEEAFRYARRREIPTIAHAGEACGPESVWETLRRLQPRRIGHGVRSDEDPALVAHLRQTRIHLEVCPSCNVQTGVVETYADHPIDRLRRQGVALGVNTDTRGITAVTLSVEYARLAETFGWGETEFRACNLDALEAAFIPAAVKEKLQARLLTPPPAS